MTIINQAPPDVEAALTRAASQEGVSVEEYALQAILHKAEGQLQRDSESADSAPQDTLSATQALFAQWAENPTSDPNELARRRHGTVKIFEAAKVHKEQPFYERATKEEWLAAFREWVERRPYEKPYLTNEQMRREHLYEDHY